MNLGKLWEIVRNKEAWHSAVYMVRKNQTQFSNSATTTNRETFFFLILVT